MGAEGGGGAEFAPGVGREFTVELPGSGGGSELRPPVRGGGGGGRLGTEGGPLPMPRVVETRFGAWSPRSV
jgi:hypothetical protein